MPTKKELSANLTDLGYDRRVDLYRQAAKDVLASNSGDARYVVQLFGPALIGSLALAFDPFKQFHNFPQRVSLLTDGNKIVRTRTPVTQQRSNRKETWQRVSISRGYLNNPQAGLFDYIYTGPTRTTASGVRVRSQQEPLLGLIRDTTYRTRPMKYDQGEFEMFIPKLTSRPRSHSFVKLDQLNYTSIGTGQRASLFTVSRSTVVGPEFLCTNAGVQALLPNIRLRALDAIQKNVYGMLDRVQPSHRTYDLYYQAAELREISLTLKGTLTAWMAFERFVGTNMFRNLLTAARHWRDPHILRTYLSTIGRSSGIRWDELRDIDRVAGEAYLTFKFGWESTVRAVVQFLPSPARATQEVNFLISRIGLDTSRRTKKTWTENGTSFPIMTSVDFMIDETVESSSTTYTGSRQCELRLVANFNIRFPKLDPPRLRNELMQRKLGVLPTPGDLYNLVPWTWVADWFAGLGDYITLMGSIANDRSLINYGFITYKEVGHTTANNRGLFTTSVLRNIDGVHADHTHVERFLHSGRFQYTYQLRRSIPSLAAVNQYWDSDLNPNQTAIIGALLSSKGGSVTRRDVS